MSALLGGAVSELSWERAQLPTCYGGLGIGVAQLGFAVQATCWSAVAIMPNICGTLHRTLLERHPEETFALVAKADLLTTEVAVDDHAMVQFECDARKFHETSPWAADREAAEVILPAPVQATDHVPPRSVARGHGLRKAAIEDLVCCGSGASCKTAPSCHLSNKPSC